MRNGFPLWSELMTYGFVGPETTTPSALTADVGFEVYGTLLELVLRPSGLRAMSCAAAFVYVGASIVSIFVPDESQRNQPVFHFSNGKFPERLMNVRSQVRFSRSVASAPLVNVPLNVSAHVFRYVPSFS